MRPLTRYRIDIVGAAIIGLVGVAVGAVITYALRRAEARTASAEHWAETAARVLGPTETLLTDGDPERLGINANPETTPTLLGELAGRLGSVREGLAQLSFGHPSARVRTLSAQLSVAMFNTSVSAGWFVHAILRHQGITDWLPRAKEDHAEARALLKELGEALHEQRRSRFIRGRSQQGEAPTA